MKAERGQPCSVIELRKCTCRKEQVTKRSITARMKTIKEGSENKSNSI